MPPERMRAAVVRAPNELIVTTVPVPEPGPYDALCQVVVSATCTGTDLHVIGGTFPDALTYPVILGHESIGRVVSVGPAVRTLRVGDLITRVGVPANDEYGVAWGGFVEFALACDHRAMAQDGRPRSEYADHLRELVVPPDIDVSSAAMFVTWRETLSYLTRLGVTSGSRLLIIGSGGNALAFLAHARNRGAAHVAIIGNDRRADRAMALGADRFYDYRSELHRAATAGPYDVIIDAVGGYNSFTPLLPALAGGGTLAVYGLGSGGRFEIALARASGSFLVYNGGYDEAEAHEQVIAAVRARLLQPRHWLGDPPATYGLDEIATAYADLARRDHVKALIKP